MADQALSLQCTECGVQLRSVKEAQDHGARRAACSRIAVMLPRMCMRICKEGTTW